MADSTFQVRILDQASTGPTAYEVTLDVAGRVVAVSVPIDPNTGLGLTEFSLTAPGNGRLTIEKPSLLHASRLPSKVVTNIPLEDVYEYNVSVKGRGSALQLIPAGFKGGKTNEKIDEVFVTFESGDNATIVTTFTLVIDQIPEFFVPETPASGRAPTPKEGQVERFRPVAHFIPGTDRTRRALIISGVHGSEPEGVRTVEKVLDALAPGRGSTPEIGRWTPAVDTVIVTAIIPRTQPAGKVHKGGSNPNEERLVNLDRKDPKPQKDPKKDRIEPNRNLPLAGVAGGSQAVSYAEARQRRRVEPDKAELEFVPLGGAEKVVPSGDHSSRVLIAENRLLLALIERFRPQRLASVHSHRVVFERGNSFGIFVDPRGFFDPDSDRPLTNAGKADDQLARSMVCAFERLRIDRQVTTQRDPLLGNKQTFTHAQAKAMAAKAKKSKTPAETPVKLVDTIDAITVHYDPKIGASTQGNSLGMWAPEDVEERLEGVRTQRGRRDGITTVTVELPQEELADGAIQKLESIHAEVLVSVFLGGSKLPESPPSSPPASPPAAPTPPGQKGQTPAQPKPSGKVWPALKGCP